MKPRPYGPFPYSPIVDRPPLRWPNGARVALWVIPNIEFFALNEKIPPDAGGGGPMMPAPDVPRWSIRDYGNRIGVFRIMDVLDRFGIRGTVALNSDSTSRSILTAAYFRFSAATIQGNRPEKQCVLLGF